MSKYGTMFQETEALLAASENDMGELNQILGEMLPGEIQSLMHNARFLADYCWIWQAGK
jgi:hypothetical protein